MKVPSIWIGVIIINLFMCTDPHMQLGWRQNMLPAASSICTNKKIIAGLHYACWEKQWKKSHMPAFWSRKPVRGNEKWQGELDDCICTFAVVTQMQREDITYRASGCRRMAGRCGREPRSCVVGHSAEPNRERCNNGIHCRLSPGKSCHLPPPLALRDAGSWLVATCPFCPRPPPSTSNRGCSVYRSSCHFLLEFNRSPTLISMTHTRA